MSYPDVVFIGEYSKAKKIEWLIEAAQEDPSLSVLIVGPKMPELSVPENVFLFRGKVINEVDAILSHGGSIGYIAHDNLSLPTAFNLYSHYSIPSVSSDVSPLNTITDEWKLGLCFKDKREIPGLIQKIRSDYAEFSKSARSFADHHTWERSREVHQRVLERITN